MARTIARDKNGAWTDAITMDCSCGHRLALLDEQVAGYLDNALGTGIWDGTPAGSGGWWRIMCPRCKKRWRASEATLLGVVRYAKKEGLHRVTLPSDRAG